MELGLDLKLRSWSWNWSWNLRSWNWSWSWNLRSWSWSWSWYSGDLPELELELELKPPELELELELIFWRLAGVGVGVGVETSRVGVGVGVDIMELTPTLSTTISWLHISPNHDLESHICVMKNSSLFPSDASCAYIRCKSPYFSHRPRGRPTKQCEAKMS